MRKTKINLEKKNPEERIKFASRVIEENASLEFELDLTKLNLIEASKTVTLLSAQLMRKNSKARMECLLKDRATLDIIKPLKLKNTFLSVNVEGKNNIRKICGYKPFRKAGSV